MSSHLLNERDPITGVVRPPANVANSAEQFWRQALGVVTPHRAQQALVTGRLQELFRGQCDPELIRDAVDTVERFQGQERDAIVVTFALGDPDQIAEEDEFLHSLNRFNVMASRARAKLIVLVSQQVVDHLASDLDVLRESRLLKSFVENFCNASAPVRLAWTHEGVVRYVDALVRTHGGL
jgi:superfamily I DNA and/or RNA helicase